MRHLHVALIFVVLAGAADAASMRVFSVSDAKSAFRSATGVRLVNFEAASTTDARSLRTRPYRTERFGTFQLFVLNPRKLERMRRRFPPQPSRDVDAGWTRLDRAVRRFAPRL